MAPNLNKEVFLKLKDIDLFMNTCMILNDTLAWDITENRDTETCIDIAPDMLYQLPASQEKPA